MNDIIDCPNHFSKSPCLNPNETPQLLAIKVSWLKALLCSMSTVQSYLTSEAFLLALQPVYAVRMKRKDLKSAVPAQLDWVSQMVSYCKGTIKRRKSIWSTMFKGSAVHLMDWFNQRPKSREGSKTDSETIYVGSSTYLKCWSHCVKVQKYNRAKQVSNFF